MNPTQLPTDGTLPLLVLQIIAVSGEFPAAFSGHFPGGSSYIESVIGKLKKDGCSVRIPRTVCADSG